MIGVNAGPGPNRLGLARTGRLRGAMPSRHIHRLATAIVVVLSLLFAQLALASCACPRQVDTVAMAAMMEAGTPCRGMDTQQPVLCHQHSTDSGKAFEAAKLPVVSLPAVVQVIELPLLPDHEASTAFAAATAGEVRPPPDPLFLSTRRLRV